MEIEIGGRKIPMLMSSYEVLTIQEEIGCTTGQIREDVFGIEHNLETDEYTSSLRSDPEKIKKFGKLIQILGNAGLEEAGQKPDLTDKWVLRNIKPLMMIPFMILINGVINDAMSMEFAAEQNGPVDEVLEEQNRKKEPGSLPTGESAPMDSLPG